MSDASKKLDDLGDEIDKTIDDIDKGKDTRGTFEKLGKMAKEATEAAQAAVDAAMLKKYGGGKDKNAYKKGTIEYEWARKVGKAQAKMVYGMAITFLIFAAACGAFLFASALPLPEGELFSFGGEDNETADAGAGDNATGEEETVIGYEPLLFVASGILSLIVLIVMGLASRGRWGAIMLHFVFGGIIVFLDLSDKEIPVMGGISSAWAFGGAMALFGVIMILTRPMQAKGLKDTLKDDAKRITHIEQMFQGFKHPNFNNPDRDAPVRLARKAMDFFNKKNYTRARASWSNCVNLLGKDAFKDDTKFIADKLIRKK